MAYAPPALNPLQDDADGGKNPVAAFTTGRDGAPAVANTIPHTAPAAPEDLSAAPGKDAGSLDLAWTTPWHNGRAIGKYQIRTAAGAAVPENTAWIDLRGSGPDTVRHTVAGLTPGAEHALELRAVNAIGPGAQAALAATAGSGDPAPRLLAAGGAEVPAGSAGLRVVLTFDEALDTASTPDKGAFAVTQADGAGPAQRTVSAVAVAGAAVTLTLAAGDAVRPGETVTVSYTRPQTGALRDTDPTPNATASFAAAPVANRLADTAPEAPGSFTAVKGAEAGAVTLAWRTPWHNGDPITGYQLQRKAAADAGYGAWTGIAGSGPGTTGHTVTGLEAGAEYGFRLRAVNRAPVTAANPAGGAGAFAEAAATAGAPDSARVACRGPDLRSGQRRLLRERRHRHRDRDLRRRGGHYRHAAAHAAVRDGRESGGAARGLRRGDRRDGDGVHL